MNYISTLILVFLALATLWGIVAYGGWKKQKMEEKYESSES